MSSKNPKNNFIQGNCYQDFPELYDLLYARYFKSIPTFIDLVKKNIPAGGQILDVAAGTGEVTLPLLRSGYVATSLDMNSGMLGQLAKKAKQEGLKNFKTVVADMGRLSFDEQFDAVCIRQAINYQKSIKGLEKFFKGVLKSLKRGGKFIFNAPNFTGQERGYPAINNFYEMGLAKAAVVETNFLSGRKLVHYQDSLIWGQNSKRPLHVTDSNTFYMYTKKEFEAALAKVGFKKISFFSSKLEKFDKQDKTLYCLATK